MSNVCYGPPGRLVDWPISTHLGGTRLPVMSEAGRFSKRLVTANHTHYQWHNISPLNNNNVIYFDIRHLNLRVVWRMWHAVQSIQAARGQVTAPTCSWRWCRTWCSGWRTWGWGGCSWRTPGAERRSQTAGRRRCVTNGCVCREGGYVGTAV